MGMDGEHAFPQLLWGHDTGGAMGSENESEAETAIGTFL